MNMAVKAVPEGWHTVTPRLFVSNAAAMVEFLKRTFDARGDYRDDGPSEIRIGDSIVMISGTGVREATAAFLYVYLEDIDAAYRRALDAGASVIEAPQDMVYGDRRAAVKDQFGNTWQIATHQEDLSLEEIRARAAAAFAAAKK
jgi:PhnB protein